MKKLVIVSILVLSFFSCKTKESANKNAAIKTATKTYAEISIKEGGQP